VSRRMKAEDVRAWRAGFAAVEEIDRRQLREESPAEKFRALAFLMASTDLFDMTTLESEDQEVRERWVRLKNAKRER